MSGSRGQPPERRPRLLTAVGVVLTLVSLWPLEHVLRAVAQRDYLGAVLLMGVTWTLARTGVELADSGQAGHGRNER